MANEGLQEVLHAAARGEKVTCVMLNNGVFGDTGGQLTATTVLGQRTKTSIEGRDAELHGFPIPVADLVASLRGAAYVARGAVSTAASVAQTKRLLRKAFEVQLAGAAIREAFEVYGLLSALTCRRAAARGEPEVLETLANLDESLAGCDDVDEFERLAREFRRVINVAAGGPHLRALLRSFSGLVPAA